MAPAEACTSSLSSTDVHPESADSVFLDKVSTLQEDSEFLQHKRVKSRPNPGGTSLSIFRKYIRRSKATDEIDVSLLFSYACYTEWTLARKSTPKNPEQAFRRTLTAHIRGTDERQPFFADEEAAILEHLRKPDPFKHTFGDISHNIGQKGFRGVGYHEQHPGKQKKSLLARINEKKRESKVLRLQRQQQKNEHSLAHQSAVPCTDVVHNNQVKVSNTWKQSHNIKAKTDSRNTDTDTGALYYGYGNNSPYCYGETYNNVLPIEVDHQPKDPDSSDLSDLLSAVEEEFARSLNHERDSLLAPVSYNSQYLVDEVPVLVSTPHKRLNWPSKRNVGNVNDLLQLLDQADESAYSSEDAISVDEKEVSKPPRRRKRKRKLTPSGLHALIQIITANSYDGEQFRRYVVPFFNQFNEAQLRIIQSRFEELDVEFFGPKVVSSFVAAFRSQDFRYSREFIVPENSCFAQGKSIYTLLINQRTFQIMDMDRFARRIVDDKMFRNPVGRGQNQVSIHYARLLNIFYHSIIATAQHRDKFWFRQNFYDATGNPIWVLTLATVVSDTLVRWDCQVIDSMAPLSPQDNIRFLNY